MTKGLGPAQARLIWTVGFVSAAVLAYEVSLMRALLVAGWHHFAFLVISVALVGFGASGTALLLARSLVMRHREKTMLSLAIATAVAMPLSWAVAQHVPVESRVIPAMLWQQIGSWVVYWAVLTVPFFAGAAVVGLALMLAGRRMGTVYGANLVGSAAGALATPAVMLLVPPAWLVVVTGCVALVGACGGVRTARRAIAVSLCVVGVAFWLWIDPPRVRMDPFKYGAHMQRLADQGAVTRAGLAWGPRAVVEAYRGEVLHDLPFLSAGPAPPPLGVLVVDGHLAGSVLDVRGAQQAEAVDGTLMAFPYELARPQPRVALLGETGGANIWLARRSGASSIDVVQGDARVIEMLRGPLADHGGRVLDLAGVRVSIAEPRHFIAQTDRRFDLIQLAMMESSAAGSGGIGGLAQDHLLTVEGISACLQRLSPDGVLAVTRGMQTPPRDNVKILATFLEALRRRGVESPSGHIVVVRDYLAVCTVVIAGGATADLVERVRAACARRQLTPVWFEGVEPDELNRPDALPQPPDGVGDWYHYAARRLASDDARTFVDEWAFDVRPPTDDRPFFGDFFRLRSLGALRDAFGELWLTRTELAFLFVVAAMAIVGLTGAVATILPLPWLPGESPRGRAATGLYFGCLGLAYLLLEMTFLSRLTFLIGDPVQGAAVTIGGFLFFSGVGSIASQWLGTRRDRAVGGVFVALVVVGVVQIAVLRWVGPAAGGLPLAGRWLAGAGLLAPAAFLMGFPMPVGLLRLGGGPLVPWAWATNGFASVLAAPLALAVAMTWGYHLAAIAALVLYAVAGTLYAQLPQSGRRPLRL